LRHPCRGQVQGFGENARHWASPGGRWIGAAVNGDPRIHRARPARGREDYRTHPFFVENFAKSEIVYCIESDNSRLSFAGLWAAKEAIAKACGIDTRLGGLSRIEIGHDDGGRPTCEFGSISISHAGEIAIAVCLAGHTVASETVAGESVGDGSVAPAEILPQPPAAAAERRISRSVMFALGLSAIVNILLAAAVLRTYYF
jgi:phosphopantetheine--protein transferase-like protein